MTLHGETIKYDCFNFHLVFLPTLLFNEAENLVDKIAEVPQFRIVNKTFTYVGMWYLHQLLNYTFPVSYLRR